MQTLYIPDDLLGSVRILADHTAFLSNCSQFIKNSLMVLLTCLKLNLKNSLKQTFLDITISFILHLHLLESNPSEVFVCDYVKTILTLWYVL